MQQQRVRDWMSRDVHVVRPDTSAFEAYDSMRRHNIRRLPVVDLDGRLLGIVTRSDIEQAMPQSRGEEDRRHGLFELAGTVVSDLMTQNPLTVTPESSIRNAAATIMRAKVSGLPVVANDRLVGIITESDIFRLVVSTWPDDDDEATEA
ncbi:MAG: CBS domain-containing protein [Oscillochloris sp.]|nr:CBS domain-containing protein [Oscillochloris sp.]